MNSLSKGLRILSFDGGGIRGISELLILLEIMSRIAYDLGLSISLRPRDYFELTGGSGTGALNAILLGRLGFTIEEAIDHYTQIAEVAFSINEMSPEQRMENLKEVVVATVKAAGLDPDTTMEASDNRGGNCKTVVFTAAVDNPASPRLLRSYRARSFKQPNCTIVDAVLAALSIPGILTPVKLGDAGRAEDFMEASLSCNNPTMELLREAEAIYRKQFKLSSLISLGSGRAAISVFQTRDGATGEVLRSMIPVDSHIEISCERIHEEVRQRTDHTGIYFRFDTGRNLDPALVLEWQQVSTVQSHTTKYLQGSEVNEQIDEVVELLREPSDGVAFSMKPREATRLAVDEQMKSQLEPSLDTQVLLQQKFVSLGGTLHDRCLTGTRVAILQKIQDWACVNTSSKPIFWLCDSAGTGKSTVAATMSDEWRTSQQLAGQFFFASSDIKASNTKLFCSTLALDVASNIPELKPKIAAAFKEDLLLSERDFTLQFRKMIAEPLRDLSQQMIIVIDAIDECDIPSRKQLLSLLIELLPSIPRLKVLITSRPEDDIFLVLKESSIVYGMEFQLQTIAIRSNVEDIQKYIDFHLGAVLSETDRLLLVEKAGGLFIWASTAKRELDPSSSRIPTKTIFRRLVSSPVTRDLNSLYSGILQRAFPNRESIEFGCQVLGIVAVAHEPISIITLTRFMSGESVKKVVDSLRSVLNYTNDDDPIHFFHPTFREYLLSCKVEPFIIDLEKAHLCLANECFSVMLEELEENICGISPSNGIYPNNKDIPNLMNDVVFSTTDVLRYSIIYWFLHLTACTHFEEVLQPATLFFETNLLHWIEILSISNQVQAGLIGLNAMKNLEISQEIYPAYLTVLDWCNDAIRLIQSQLADIEENALKPYSTVLSFAPRKSLIYKTYGSAFEQNLPKLLVGKPEIWPTHEIISGHTSSVNSISVHGERFVSGSSDKTLRMWSSRSGAGIGGPFIGHTEGVSCVAFSPDGTRVVSGSSNNKVVLWESETGRPLGEPLRGHTSSVNAVAFSPDGVRVVSASDDHTIRLWDLCISTNIPIVLERHTSLVASVVFSSDGTIIASGSWDRTVRIWDGITGKKIRTLRGHDFGVNCIEFSPDGNLLASASKDKTIRIWSIETWSYTGGLSGHTDSVNVVKFSSNSAKLASGSNDNSIRLWNVDTRQCITQLNGHTELVSCVAFLPSGNRIISGSSDHTIRIWDLDIQQEVEKMLNVHSKSITGVAFSPCGSKVATSSEDSTLRLWSASTGVMIGDMKGGQNYSVLCFAFSPDGETIVSGSYEAGLRLWDVGSQNRFKVLDDHARLISCVAFSHAGTRIISGSELPISGAGKLYLWDSKSGTQIGNPFGGDLNRIISIAFSPDDTMIVSGSKDHVMRLWNITGEKLRGYRHGSTIRLVAFSTDNAHILSASDRDIAIWSISSSDKIAQFPHDQSPPLPIHIQFLNFDLDAALFSDGREQSSAATQSVLRYFGNHRSPQLNYNNKTRTISSSHSSNYAFPLPVDLREEKWKSRNGILVIGGRDGRVMILDFNHLFVN